MKRVCAFSQRRVRARSTRSLVLRHASASLLRLRTSTPREEKKHKPFGFVSKVPLGSERRPLTALWTLSRRATGKVGIGPANSPTRGARQSQKTVDPRVRARTTSLEARDLSREEFPSGFWRRIRESPRRSRARPNVVSRPKKGSERKRVEKERKKTGDGPRGEGDGGGEAAVGRDLRGQAGVPPRRGARLRRLARRISAYGG